MLINVSKYVANYLTFGKKSATTNVHGTQQQDDARRWLCILPTSCYFVYNPKPLKGNNDCE